MTYLTVVVVVSVQLLVGNKKDLADKGRRAVTSWMAEDWAYREGADYVEVSALETDAQELEAAFLSLSLIHI